MTLQRQLFAKGGGKEERREAKSVCPLGSRKAKDVGLKDQHGGSNSPKSSTCVGSGFVFI